MRSPSNYYGDGKPLPPDQIAARCSALIDDPLLTRTIGHAVLAYEPRADGRSWRAMLD